MRVNDDDTESPGPRGKTRAQGYPKRSAEEPKGGEEHHEVDELRLSFHRWLGLFLMCCVHVGALPETAEARWGSVCCAFFGPRFPKNEGTVDSKKKGKSAR